VLVLTRRAGESIVIGDDVRVIVLDVRGDTVRLGIEAPRSVQVHRAEVYAEVQAANAAAASNVDDLGALAGRLQRLARPAPGARSGTRRSQRRHGSPDPADPPRPRPPARPGPGQSPTGSPSQPPVPAPPPAGRPVPAPPPSRRPPRQDPDRPAGS